MTETSTYIGYRDASGTAHVRRIRDGKRSPLPLRLNIENHSPTGFEWGYGGSGPAQLALAILADALHDNQRAARLHQDFKWKTTGGFARDGFRMSRAQVLRIVRQIESERQASEPCFARAP